MISVPCLAEEEEEPEGLWSSLLMDSALGNVEALHKIWQRKFGSKASRFGSPTQAVTADIQEVPAPLHRQRSRTHRGFAQGPTLLVTPNLGQLCLSWDLSLLPALPAAAGLEKGHE